MREESARNESDDDSMNEVKIWPSKYHFGPVKFENW